MAEREIKVNEAELRGLLQDLVRAASPSPPGDISACTRLLTRVLEREGIAYRIDESKPGIQNLIAELPGALGEAEEGPCLLFNGHLDTVPAGEAWAEDPYSALYRDGCIEGRGSVDMKGGIAASLLALVSLKRSGRPFRGRILYTAVGDEEFHSEFGTKYLIGRGLKADFAVCCEPTGLELELGNRGLMMVDVHLKGRASHAGRPNLGVNAVHRAARIVDSLDRIRFDHCQNPAFEVPAGSCTAVCVRGGERLNVVPDRCSLYLDCRLMPGDSGQAVLQRIAELIEQALGCKPDIGADRGGEVVLLPEYWHEPCWTPEASPIAACARRAIQGVTGSPPQIRGKAAGTDASHLVSLAGIPTVIVGPGDFRLSHTAQERVRFSEVWAAVRIYQAMVLDMLRG
jgi:acetylornithine deacetylase/succinyl-diaminopimelate desuccinylase-like protein